MSDSIVQWNSTEYQKLYQMAESKKLAHAILLSGASGIGKDEFARQFAKMLCCKQPVDNVACDSCKNCVLFRAGNYFDILQVRAENGKEIVIDQVRNLIAELTHHALQGGWQGNIKVVIIQSAELMNIATSNCILKVLEEPPPKVHFILTCSSFDKLLATIRSRVQKIYLNRPTIEQSRQYLQSLKITAAEQKLVAEVLRILPRQPLLIQKIIEQQILSLIVELISKCQLMATKKPCDIFVLAELLANHKEQSKTLWKIYFLIIMQFCRDYQIFADDLYWQIFQAMAEQDNSGIDQKMLWLCQLQIWQKCCKSAH